MVNKIVIILAVYMLSGCSAEERQAPAAPAIDPNALTDVEFSVSGMVCDACSGAIKDAIEMMPGVASCVADHKAENTKIRFDPSQVKRTELAEAITKLGYTVGPVP